jgi:DGQHR domain-containing protein
MTQRRGIQLENRVADLFKIAGFGVKRRRFVKGKEVDVLAGFTELTSSGRFENEPLALQILIETKEVTKHKLSVRKVIDKYAERKKICRADAAIIVITGQNIEEYAGYAKKKKVLLWGNAELDELGNQLRKSVFRSKELLVKALQIKFKPGSPINVPAIKIRQRKRSFYIISMNIADLLEIACVDRRGINDSIKDPHGYQRILKERRLKDIGKYYDRTDACLPNAIIVNFSHGFKIKKKLSRTFYFIEIPRIKYSAWVIDGQHRLYGFEKSEKKKPMRILVSGYFGIPKKDQAKIFRTINDEQRKMDPSLVYDLLDFYPSSAEDYHIHHIIKYLNEHLPWEDTISMTGESDEKTLVKQVAFTYNLKKIYGKSKSKILIEKRVKKDGEKKSLYRIELNLKDLEILLAIFFAEIHSLFEKQWEAKRKYILTKSLGINGLLGLFPYALLHMKKRMSIKDIGKKEAAARRVMHDYLKHLKRFNFSSNRDFPGGFKGFDKLTKVLLEYRRKH